MMVVPSPKFQVTVTSAAFANVEADASNVTGVFIVPCGMAEMDVPVMTAAELPWVTSTESESLDMFPGRFAVMLELQVSVPPLARVAVTVNSEVPAVFAVQFNDGGVVAGTAAWQEIPGPDPLMDTDPTGPTTLNIFPATTRIR